MSDPVMDKIEQDLSAITTPSNEPTELWKRALEISRADERASLVHPGRETDAARERPRGRRLFLALNTVGVAAMIALATGVWTVAWAPVVPVEHTAIAGESESIAPPIMDRADSPEPITEADEMLAADVPATAGPHADKNVSSDDGLSFDFGDNSTLEFHEAEAESRSRTSLRAPAQAKSVTEGNAPESADIAPLPPGIAQSPMALEERIELGSGSAAAFGETRPTIELVNTHIILEVDDIDSAYVALSELPDADLNEFSSIELGENNEAMDVLTLNFTPARLDVAMGLIEEIGTVVESKYEPDNRMNRTSVAMNFAADNIGPQSALIEKLYNRSALSQHAKAHSEIDVDEIENLDEIRLAMQSLARNLENARRSMNLSRIRVMLRTPIDDSNTTE